MTHTKEFLISELQRFVLENDTIPTALNMQGKFGYPSCSAYLSHFGTWNNALITAELQLNHKQHNGILIGTETCDICNKLRIRGQHWHYKNGQRLCRGCYQSPQYKNNNLNPKSATGFAFISQRVVAKALVLDLKYDCNCSQGFDAPHDLFDEKLGYINVKASVLYKNNVWSFGFKNKEISDTYVLLGFSADKSDILHVWITDPADDLTFEKTSIGISDNINSGLKRAESWEVDCKLYNDAYHSMSLENCSVLRSD